MTFSTTTETTKKQPSPDSRLALASLSDLELAQVLAERLAIKPNDWHRLNRNRPVRAQEQLTAALVYLLSQKPDEALPRVEQALGWLNRSVTAPPCPTHGQPKGRDTHTPN